jgi:hypothetical protein
MSGYIRPAVITSYSIERLCADAAACMSYVAASDLGLKRDIETVERPLERMRAIRGA